jgi:hypothetical protein
MILTAYAVEGDGTDVWDGLAFLAALFLVALFLGALFFEATFFAGVLGSAAATTGACVSFVGFAAFLAALLTFAQRIFIAAAILARPAADIFRRG